MVADFWIDSDTVKSNKKLVLDRPIWHDQKIDIFSQMQECWSNK
jgi:hypothetical protein